MNIEQNDGFNLIYAKSGGIPKNCYFDNKKDVIKFLMENLNNIDFISINDVIIDKELLIKNNLTLSAYLKNKMNNEI